MENIRLNTASGSSSIVYIRDSFDDLFPLLSAESEIVVVIDKNVNDLIGDKFPYKKVVIEVSEQKKNLSLVEYIIGELLYLEAGRNCLLIGIGGGITTDVTGLVASIYKRGVEFAYIATTLLAQVDASFGGKTGVNYAGYKNIVGSIIQPKFTYINLSVLKTLNRRELLSGAAEMIKSFIIADRNAYVGCVNFFKENSLDKTLFADSEKMVILSKFVSTAIKIKSWIVERDEMEKGERRLLNLGHTFGHAVERCCMEEEDILHGEAISIGMIIAAKLSCNMGYITEENLERLQEDLQSIGLPVSTNIPVERLFSAIKNDKKREGGDIYFVMLQNIGQAFIKKMTLKELEDVVYDLY